MKINSKTKKIIFHILFTALLLTNGLHAWTWTGQTGAVNNVALGTLIDDSVVQENDFSYINYSIDLDDQTFDLYIPKNYDASKPFGLISYVSAGSNGVPPTSYKATLEDKNIIWIGGNGIGNGVNERNRTGAAINAIYRGIELFNIDTDRIYISGNSGGARAVSVLYWAHPELVTGVIANIGSLFPKDLPDDMYIERANPGGWPDYEYEYGFYYSPKYDSFIRNVATYEHPIAVMTGYADFREEYILLIHHQGYKPFGFDSKILSYDKGHTNAESQQFFDAVSFVEHPRFLRVEDTFSDNNVSTNSDNGAGFYNFSQTGATVTENGGSLKLTPTATAIASVASETPLLWHDMYGAMIDFSFKTEPTAGDYNQRTAFGIWLEQEETFSEYRQPNQIQFSNLSAPSNTAALLFTIEQSDGSSKLTMAINDTVNALSEHNDEQVFEVEFSADANNATYPGWVENSSELDVRLHLMETELIIEFTRHFDPATFIAVDGAALLDDYLTIRVPWNDLPAGMRWLTGTDPADAATNSWPTSKRCLFTISTEALDANGRTPGRVEVSYLKIRDAGAALTAFDFDSYTTPQLSDSIEYSALAFVESLADDGSIMNELTLTLIGDTFAGANGASFLPEGKATVTGLPTGLTANLVKISDTQLALSLSGNALAHDAIEMILGVSLELSNSAFSGGNASAITNSLRNDIEVQFFGESEFVSSSADSGPGSLRKVLLDTDATRIRFDPSVTSITLTSGEILIDKSIVIDGGLGVIIDGNRNGHIFYMSDSSNNALDIGLIGLTLQNAEHSATRYGGAIQNEESLTIENCTFDANFVIHESGDKNAYSRGGAIYSSGNLTLINSTFTENKATHTATIDTSIGGAICQSGNILTVTDCIFDSNVAEGLQSGNHGRYGQGGAFYISDDCVATITRTQISNNQAISNGGTKGKGTANGGAILLDSSQLTIVDCTLNNNLAQSGQTSGGAIRCWSGNQTTSVTLERCTLSNNTATAETYESHGGAIAVDESSDNLATVTLKNCTLSGNLVNSTNGNDALGGAIYQSRSMTDSDIGMTNVLIYNSTVAGNQSTSSDATRGKGGAFYLNRGQMTLHSSIVANNAASDAGQDIYLDATQFTSLTADYSMIKSASDNHGLIDGVNNNIVGVDPALGALADNGGLTQTHALLSGSPAIDAGANAQALVYDQRGSGFDRLVDSQTDIGAFELLAAQGGFTVWAVDSGLTGEDAASDADPDGDGELNLLEYFVGSDPSSAGSVQINATIEGGDKLAISYQSDNAVEPTDVTVIIQGSTDLGITDPWAPIAATHSVSGTGPYTHTWTQNQAIGSEDKAFIRIILSD